MKSTQKLILAFLIILSVVLVSIFTESNQLLSQNNSVTKSEIIRIGYFPNLSHAQAVIGIGNGDFQRELGDVKIEPVIFNAGPAAIESLFAGRIDVAYVGPNPTINGYIKSNGEALRIISGSASGGAVLVVRDDSGINSISDFSGKKFASPQLGNTQDVALRSYLVHNGYDTIENGGNVEVIPVKNADIHTLILKKEIDGAWVPEPWGAKLIKETNVKLFLDERDLWPQGKFVTSNIIVSTNYLNNHPDVIEKLLVAHVDKTQWINQNKEGFYLEFNKELEKITGKTIPEDEIRNSISRMDITYDPIKESLFKAAKDAYDLGFLGETKPNLTGIYDLQILNKVLLEKNLPVIP